MGEMDDSIDIYICDKCGKEVECSSCFSPELGKSVNVKTQKPYNCKCGGEFKLLCFDDNDD